MKFGKEFSSQMVPEWKEAYMEYGILKTLLKDLLHFKQKSNRAREPTGGLARKLSLYRSFSGLTLRHNNSSRRHHHYHHHHHHHLTSPRQQQDDLESPNQPIIVNHGPEKSETTFLMTAEEGGEYELVYFRRLDDEFNKVNRFYRERVEEVMKDASMLNKQMDALIAFRIKVENPDHQDCFDRSLDMSRLASGIAASLAALSASKPLEVPRSDSGRVELEVIEEGGSSTLRRLANDDDILEDEIERNEEVNQLKIIQEKVEKKKSKNMEMREIKKPAPLEVLNRVKINNIMETPRSTIKGVLNVPNCTELKFNKKNLESVERQLRQAFIAFHYKLRLLKSYCFLNVMAFSKIMKKYDKVTSRGASKAYLKMVDDSYLGGSDEVTRLLERVEATFIKHFANSNRSKGMSILRPKAKRERHRITFSLGFSVGCTVALLVALIVAINFSRIIGAGKPGATRYMENLFPLYSLFGFIVLHMILYAANIYFWKRYGVNYSFIFGFKEGTQLSYREVLLVSFSLAILALATVISNIDMKVDTSTSIHGNPTKLLPLFLVVLIFTILTCPFNIIYRSSRFFLLTCLFRSICAPLYKVTLPDFFLADQLTSQVQALRSVGFYICYYGWGKDESRDCKDSNAFEAFSFIIAVIPYWARFLQCLRRLYDEKDAMHGYNGIKFFLTLMAVCMRTAYTYERKKQWKIMAWIVSAAATVFTTYWDIIVDWGLLQRHSKNRWLRDKLLIQCKYTYFIVMILNAFLRLAWIQTVAKFQVPSLHNEATVAVVAGLEIIRRGIWNFFRLENEHLNNVGKYRAFKTVPLPFNYDEDDNKDE